MTCTTTCLCRCGQISCGCREGAAPKRGAPPAAMCGSCSGPALRQTVRTDANRVVTLTWCPVCDRRRPT